MKIRLLREREILKAIRKEFSDIPRDLILGIGDDASVIKTREKYLILTKDLLIEDYHFIVSLHPPYFLGRKSLNVNLSDVAAMGGKAKVCASRISVSSKDRAPLGGGVFYRIQVRC
jgi:thiamine-monophosphate kinase